MIRRMLVLDPNQRYNIEHVRHHAWMARQPAELEIPTEHVGAQRIEPREVGSLLEVGFNSEDIEQSVGLDRPDHVNTSYLLLLEKARRREAFGGGGGGGGGGRPPSATAARTGSGPPAGSLGGHAAGTTPTHRPALQPEQQAAQAALLAKAAQGAEGLESAPGRKLEAYPAEAR